MVPPCRSHRTFMVDSTHHGVTMAPPRSHNSGIMVDSKHHGHTTVLEVRHRGAMVTPYRDTVWCFQSTMEARHGALRPPWRHQGGLSMETSWRHDGALSPLWRPHGGAMGLPSCTIAMVDSKHHVHFYSESTTCLFFVTATGHTGQSTRQSWSQNRIISSHVAALSNRSHYSRRPFFHPVEGHVCNAV